MRKLAYRRIAAAVLACAMVFSYNSARGSVSAWDNAASIGLSIGSSDSNLPGDVTPGGGEEGEEWDSSPSLGWSGGSPPFALGDSSGQEEPSLVAEPILDFKTLQSTIQNTKEDLYLVLGDNINMAGTITVPVGRTIVIDGLHEFQIDQVSTHCIVGQLNSNITLKDLTVVGRYENGIVTSGGANGSVTYDNITYSGPQPFYGPGWGSKLTIKNGGRYHIKKQDDGGWSANQQEFSETAYVVFDGGKTEIIHAWDEANTNSVFYLIHGSNGYIQLINNADVTVRSGNYILHNSDVGAIPISLEKGCRLDIVAAGFNRTAEAHFISSVTVGENAYFSYKQQGTPRPAGTLEELAIRDSLTVEEGGTFLYSSSTGLRSIGTNTFHSPALVSIYSSNENGAFYNDKGDWYINGVNAVNYWNSNDGAPAPDDDLATNWPEYLWNTWYATDSDTYKIGGAFSFSGTVSGGVTVGGDLSDALGRNDALLKDALNFKTAKRLVFGNITPFEVNRFRPAQGITGVVDPAITDIMAQFETDDGQTKWSTGPSLPLEFEAGQLPKSGSTVAVVANKNGLRAGVQADAFGVLELVSMPREIYYGEHELPASLTTYPRQYCSPSDEEGHMTAQVLDSRGDRSSPWELTLQISEQTVPGKELLPPSALIFRTHNGDTLALGRQAVTIYSHGKAVEDYADYQIKWDNTQGLLAQAYPGQLEPGSYAAVLNWSVQAVPDKG